MGIALFLLEDYLLYLLGIGEDFLCRFVIDNKVIYERALIEERILAEQMQLIELYGINATLDIHCGLQCKRLLILERKKLHTHMLDVIQFLAAELLEEHL